MDEDELDFDFEQDLQPQQSAATAAYAGPGGLVRLPSLLHGSCVPSAICVQCACGCVELGERGLGVSPQHCWQGPHTQLKAT